MKKLTVFYLESCPYCIKAKDAEKEIRAENPSLRQVETEWIEESLHPDIADKYDYYRVPSVFCGSTKLYECSPKDDFCAIKTRFENAMKLVSE